ncbi:MAG: hypothetical protein IBJ07_06530 [Rhizobiaceae bacterium]|nr:hypothetical protein [Rhizobiaceae bacterium]
MNTPTGSNKRNCSESHDSGRTSARFSERVRLIFDATADRLGNVASIGSHSVLGEYLPIHDLFEAILRADGRLVAEIIQLYYAAEVRVWHSPYPQDLGSGRGSTQTDDGPELSGTPDAPQAQEAEQRQSITSVFISNHFENVIAIAQPYLGRTVILMIAPKGARQISDHAAERARLMLSRARHVAVEARKGFDCGQEVMHIEALILDLTLDGPSTEAGVIGLSDLDNYLDTGDRIGTDLIPHYRAELTFLIDEHARWRTANTVWRSYWQATGRSVAQKLRRNETSANVDGLAKMPIATVRIGEPPALTTTSCTTS